MGVEFGAKAVRVGAICLIFGSAQSNFVGQRESDVFFVKNFSKLAAALKNAPLLQTCFGKLAVATAALALSTCVRASVFVRGNVKFAKDATAAQRGPLGAAVHPTLTQHASQVRVSRRPFLSEVQQASSQHTQHAP
jgi:hypothetical protein